ncbi:hypothetical protein BH11BAC6_BH11BAC6_18010 [soil metagenome]
MGSNLIEHEHYYFNEAGLMVFTKAYHLERGYCCGNGCMHCPYNYEAVPEPQKTYCITEHNKRTAQEDSH